MKGVSQDLYHKHYIRKVVSLRVYHEGCIVKVVL